MSVPLDQNKLIQDLVGLGQSITTGTESGRLTVPPVRRAASSNAIARIQTRVPTTHLKRQKLQDHVLPTQGRVRKRKVVIAYKRSHTKSFVHNHVRRIHELYFIKHIGGNFLDSIYLFKQNNTDIKELNDLLDRYKIPSPSNQLPTKNMSQAPEVPGPIAVPVFETQHSAEHISIPIPEKIPELVSFTIPEPIRMTHSATITVSKMERFKQKADKPGSKTPKKFSEKMKAEAAVMQRVSELQKEGMWYDKRLPKSHDQTRCKSHWDYLLEEMHWLATDFAVERKWKRIAARKCAKMVEKYHADKKLAEEKAKKDEIVRVQKIASFMGREVRNFWSNAQKLVEYKEQSKIEELRKKTMDQHLSFIVDQTEKISSMLAESFSNEVKPHRLALQDELKPEPVNTLRVFDDSLNTSLSDDEFLPTQESEDDEETIALAETEAKDVRGEVDLLQKESEMSIDDVLDELPMEYVQAILSDKTTKQEGIVEKVPQTSPVASVSSVQKCETDYEPSESESDFEDTILEEEKLEAESPQKNSAAELKELEDDNLLSVEQLRAKYTKSLDLSEDDSTDVDNGESDAQTESDEEDEEESSDIVNETDDKTVEEELQQTSLASLLQTFAPERAGEDHGDDELNSVAAMVESFQPKGYTLSSTTVATKVPILLKHTLREYQHIGLDWLVTMYEKKLNGILADEMGLGKTIQTIALIAHLAVEKGNWGPHLIIVPTSVMLNWEMEFMKWCPGLKVLTYYGSIKERKLKRTGWTKPNTFHICITSYKILIQDHQAFRRKRWRYLILDEAQNIKNFKSQRWQLLLNFSTQRRLLLTGTPLQNNLMELWSLMHFLMPNVFQSHREFREWFSNPMTGMIEGNSEYNENIIKRLHKVLRPFILRRLKCEVEKQLPQKYEHVIMCRLSKRQRFLYEDFMSRARTKETLKTGNLLSVINVLMQLRKVCNHPNLFEPRPIISPLQTRGLIFLIPSLVWNIPEEQENNTVSYNIWNVVQNEKALDKDTPARLRHLTSKNIVLATRRSGTTSESTKLSKSKQMRNAREQKHVEHQPMLVQDGDDECRIVFEKKHDPIELRRALYSYDKSKVPNPPRLRTPFAIFTMAVRPPQPLLRDKEFIHAVSLDTPDPQRLTPADIASTNWVQQDEGIFEVPDESNLMDFPLPQKPTPPKRMRKPLKSSRYDSSIDFETVSNGSEASVTSNGVCISQYEKPQKAKTTTIQYASRGVKRKRVFDYVETRLLDTIVLDVEGPLQPEEVTEEDIQQIAVTSKSNGVDDEGSDEYEDSEEESQTPLRKIAKLDKSVKRRSRRESDTSKSSKYAELGEDGDYEEVPETSNRKRKLPVAAITQKPRELVDLINIEPDYIFYRKLNYRRNVIRNMRQFNAKRISINIAYGADLLSQVECLGVMPTPRYFQKQKNSSLLSFLSRQPEELHHDSRGYFNSGYHEIMMVKRIKSSLHEFERSHPYSIWRHTKGLLDAIWTLKDVLKMLEDILKRFLIYTPAVTAPMIQFRVFRPSVSKYAAELAMNRELSINLKHSLKYLRPIFSSMATQFPDPRLIQYDCGKLQVLDGLLRRLKTESHRALIFTQMAKMLDVLEAFLNHHGYIYLRLDGATKIDQRQLLMERFNTDKKIFCFILSTRSGGIGVNLTGADTVIFYDSDWNPTMDAQAQDRCHRIGQTRDVHIYRLVSEKTIEENILKKSNQKRLLGELAIEGGNFTTAHFQKNTIHDLFDVDDEEGDAKKRMAEILETPIPSPSALSVKIESHPIAKKEDGTKKATYMFESALAAAEDESDVQAARTVRAEAAAELAEFDEDIPLDDDIVETDEQSKIQQEMEFIMSELTTVELYALRFMERTIQDWSKDTYANAQKELEQQKLEWAMEQEIETPMVLGCPIPLTTVEEQLEDMLTYPRLPQDYWFDEVLSGRMTAFGPPNPPQDDDDIYFDKATSMLYDINSTIPEHLLPRVWQSPKKSKDGSVTEVAITKVLVEETTVHENNSKKGGTPKVNRRDDPIFAPRSLFDRPSPALAKLRRDYKIQKLSKTGSRFPVALAIVTSQAAPKTLGPGAITFPITGPKLGLQQTSVSADLLEWTIPEDNYLLQSMTHILELPVNLLIVNLAQTPNWDFTTEVVNSISRIHRSTKQCRLRYEQVIKPREEGKLLEPPVSLQKKNKKIKTLIKVAPPSPTKARTLKTSEIVASDNNAQYKTMYMKKFEAIKMLAKKRMTTGSLMSFNPSMRLPKQNSVFAEHNINFDIPVSAITVAAMRYERVMADRAKLIAAQRAHQAELATVGQAQRSLPSVIHLSSPQIQVLHSIGGNSQEHLLQSQGIVLSSSPNSNTIQQPPGLNAPIQVPSSLIATPGTPQGILLPPQTQSAPQRTLMNTPIHIHQTSSTQNQQPIQVHQGTGQTMILTHGPQQPTTMTSSAVGHGSAFPIVIPVSSTSMVRANSLLQRPTIQTQSLGTTPNTLQTPQKFVITQRELQQQQQHIQLQSTPPLNQPIIISSSQGSTAMSSAMGLTSTPILVSSGGTPPSSGIMIPHQSTTTITPRSPVFFQTGATKQQIQISPQSKQVFISQQAESTQILTSQAGQTMMLAPTLAQALTVPPPASPGISSNQPSLVSGTTTVSPNVITIPTKVQPPIFSQGQQLYTLHDLVAGAHIIPTTASPPRTLVSSPDISQSETISGLTMSPGGTTVIGTVKTVPTQGTVPTYISRSDIEATVSESTRSTVTASGNNIFVQLTGVPPGTKLTQTQIQQLRQSILHQQKGFVSVSPPSSQQPIRPDCPSQQMKRIQIVPTSTTQTNVIGTSASPTQVAIPISTNLPSTSTSIITSQSVAAIPSNTGNIVAINTGMGTRLMKQQIVGGKSITRPVSEADIQMFLKQRGFTQPGTTRINVSTTPGMSSQVTTVGSNTEQGDGQSIPTSVSSISGFPGDQSQGRTIILPAKGTPATATITGGPQIITVPISQAQGLKNTGPKQPIIATMCLQKGSGANQVSLVRGIAPVSTLTPKFTSSCTTVKQHQEVKTSAIADAQKAQSFGLVSALSLARNSTLPAGNRNLRGNQTLPPKINLASQTIHGGFTRPSFMPKDNVININTSTVMGVNTRPTISLNQTTTMKPRYYTPVSQVSLVRGTVPMSTLPTTVTTLPVTYSAAKTSILKIPATAGETIARPQLIQQQPHRLTPTHPLTITTTKSSGTAMTVTTGPPQLIASTSNPNAAGVITIFTTTAGTLPTESLSLNSNPTLQ